MIYIQGRRVVAFLPFLLLTMTNFSEIINREGTASVKYDLRQLIFERADVMPMWVADMDFKTPEFIIEAIQQRLNHPVLGYTFRDEGFATSMQSWLQRRHNYQVETEWVCFSPGIVSALVLLIEAFTKPDDGVIIQTPVYHPFFHVTKHLGRKVLNNELLLIDNQYYIDFDDLEVKAREAKMLILCSPHNPVSRVWKPEELSRLVHICHKYNVLIISDEIHSDLILEGYQHTPLAVACPEFADDIISCYAPSKTFNIAGLATSAVVISNSEKRRLYLTTLEKLHMGMGNLFGAVAFQAAYNQGDAWLDEMLAYLNQTVKFVKEFINERLPVVKLIEPQATYMLWLDFRSCGMNDQELKNFLIYEAGIGLNDGFMFGAGGEGFQRMNIACAQQVVAEALIKIENALKTKGIL